MARKATRTASSRVPAGMAWYAGLVALVVVCVILFWVLMLSGVKETQDAFGDGRRVLITIATSEVEGKQALVTKSVASIAAEAASSAIIDKPDEKPEEKPAEKTPEKTEGVTVAVAPNAPQSSVPSLSAEPAAAPAATPLAGLNPALVQETTDGPLPVIGSDGTTPWRYYAKPYKHEGNQPMIAIIVSGLGEGKAVTDSATKLPENITLSFSPYTRDLTTWVTAARTTGHEVMIDLPLETSKYPATDPGPYGLLLSKDQPQNPAHLQTLMTRVPGYIGFLTPQDEVFSSNDDAFKILLQMLSTHGLMLAVGREPGKSDTRQTLEGSGTASVIADVLLDEDLAGASIQARLSTLEQVAKNRGYAIGIARAYPVTLDQVNAWANKLQSKGIVLVPVSFIVKSHFS